MIKAIITLITLIHVTLVFSQVNNQYILIKANIVDENTQKVMPFATVFNKQLANGTASNINGYFELPNNRIGDTIVVSYLGYKDKILIASPNMDSTIRLSPYSALLNEVVVVAESDYLYDIVSKVRKSKKTSTKTSKSYFFLETKLFDESIEIIESYYL